MDNLSILELIDIFIVNSEILLRATSRKARDASCTYGAKNTSSLCKSFYSTRCVNTTSAFNLFFQDDVIYYNNNGVTEIDQIGIDIIYMERDINILYPNDDYRRQYLQTVEQLCNFMISLRGNTLFTFTMAGPNMPVPAGTVENLVGHIYNIVRIEEGGIFRNYVIQGYVYKYSPICFEIDDNTFRDYIRLFYAIRTKSAYSVPNLVNYNFYTTAPNIVYTMFILDQSTNNIIINPWFNEKYNEFFKEYYYNPFIRNRTDKDFSNNPLHIRTYNRVQMSIANLNSPSVCYYNMISFMYTYYGIISYDIYIYRMQHLTTIQPLIYGDPIQYRYIFSDFIQEVDIPGADARTYEANNPTVYLDDELTTNNKHLNIFWENNPYMRFSYILSNSDKVLVPGTRYDEEDINFIFDLYSTLLYSAKTSIMNVNSYIETVSCNENTIINSQLVREMYMDTLISRYLFGRYQAMSSLNRIPLVLEKIYAPYHLLINSFDMYDYYNDKSCIMYKIIIDALNRIQDGLDRNIVNELLVVIQEIDDAYFNLSDADRENLPERVINLINNIRRFTSNSVVTMIEEIGTNRRPTDNTLINGYNSMILNPIISFIVPSLGFLLCDKVVRKLNLFYNVQRGNPVADITNLANLIQYENFVGSFYSNDFPEIFNNIALLFRLMKIVLDNIINTQYPDLDQNIDQVAKPYSVFIRAMKNALLEDLGLPEVDVITNIRVTNPNLIV